MQNDGDSKGNKRGDLKVTMKGILMDNKPTPINMTNHSYFNLDGHDSKEGIDNHFLEVYAEEFTPVDKDLIATKEVLSLDEGPEVLGGLRHGGQKLADLLW